MTTDLDGVQALMTSDPAAAAEKIFRAALNGASDYRIAKATGITEPQARRFVQYNLSLRELDTIFVDETFRHRLGTEPV